MFGVKRKRTSSAASLLERAVKTHKSSDPVVPPERKDEDIDKAAERLLAVAKSADPEAEVSVAIDAVDNVRIERVTVRERATVSVEKSEPSEIAGTPEGEDVGRIIPSIEAAETAEPGRALSSEMPVNSDNRTSEEGGGEGRGERDREEKEEEEEEEDEEELEEDSGGPVYTTADIPYKVKILSTTDKRDTKKAWLPTNKEAAIRDLCLSEKGFRVEPEQSWNSMKRFRKFVTGGVSFKLHDYVYVLPDHKKKKAKREDTDYWIGRVVEIRASDQTHVYLRIYWMYWPNELPMKRQPYHGKKELITSNYFEIIDAQTVSSHAEVYHWKEKDAENIDFKNCLYWRQTLDAYNRPYRLGPVREHCKCKKPMNPDQLMLRCNKCKIWLHDDCVKKDVRERFYRRLQAQEALEEAESEKKDAGRRSKSMNGRGGLPAASKIAKAYQVDLVPAKDGGQTKAIVRRRSVKNPEPEEIDVKCLCCEEAI